MITTEFGLIVLVLVQCAVASEEIDCDSQLCLSLPDRKRLQIARGPFRCRSLLFSS